MAFLTEHPAAIEKMQEYIRYVLRHQDEEGYIGIYQPQARYRHTMENAELWAQSRIFRKAYQTGYSKLEGYMVPGGAVHSGKGEDVEGKPPLPCMPYEYCGITELFDT